MCKRGRVWLRHFVECNNRFLLRLPTSWLLHYLSRSVRADANLLSSLPIQLLSGYSLCNHPSSSHVSTADIRVAYRLERSLDVRGDDGLSGYRHTNRLSAFLAQSTSRPLLFSLKQHLEQMRRMSGQAV